MKSDCSPDLNSSPPSSPLRFLLLLILLPVHSEAMRPEWNQWKQQRETNQDLQHGHLMMMMMIIMIMCMNSTELDSKDFCFSKRFTKTCCVISSQHLNTRTCRTNILSTAIATLRARLTLFLLSFQQSLAFQQPKHKSGQTVSR